MFNLFTLNINALIPLTLNIRIFKYLLPGLIHSLYLINYILTINFPSDTFIYIWELKKDERKFYSHFF